MGLKYYLNLVKKESDIEAVKLKYFINMFILAAYFIFIVMYFSFQATNAVLSGVCGMAGLLLLLLNYIMNYRFKKFLSDIIDNEPLDKNDTIDAAFISYRKGYTDENSKKKFSNKVVFIGQIIFSVTFIAALQLSIVLNITGNQDLAYKIFGIIDVMMLVFIVLIVVLAFFSGFKNGVWYQNYIKELDVIKEYKAVQQGAAGKQVKQKYKILEDKKPKEQMKYLFTDEKLRNKAAKLQKYGAIFGSIMGGIFGASLVLLSLILQTFMSEEDAGFYGGIILLVMLCGIVVFCVWNSLATKNTIKTQYKALKENADENSLYIKLHELRTPFLKRWGVICLLIFIGSIVSNFAFAALVSVLAKTDAYGWIFFLLFLAEIIAMIVIYSKAFGKLRLKMMTIEKEIDRKKENQPN